MNKWLIIKERKEFKRNIDLDAIVELFFSYGIQNGYFEVLAEVETLDDVRKYFADNHLNSFARKVSGWAVNFVECEMIYGEEYYRDEDDDDDEWEPTGNCDNADIIFE